MSNTIKTLADGDILRKALPILHNKLVFTKTINKYYEDKFAQTGHKNGGTILLREPNQFTVREGAVMDTQDVTERTQPFTVAKQLGVDLNFSNYELTMSMDDFAERILTPAMTRLAAKVDSYGIATCYPSVYNWTYTTSGTKPVLADVLAARAKLAQGLAPTGDRTAMVNALAANSVITDSKSIYNPASEISRQYTQGLLGEIAGFNFYETEMTPTHTNGTRTDSTPTTSTASLSNGVTSITVTANASSTTYSAGDIFTIAGVYAVNEETKAVYPHLQQFACATAFVSTATSTGTITISPTVYTSGAYQNVSVVTSSATALMTNLTLGGSGAASAAQTHCLMYHKDAFTMASVDLEMPPGQGLASRKVMEGISMRYWRAGDIINDKTPCRIDVLVGFKTVRPQWACRMIG